ncbi:TMEM175 family protein [Georgenia sp. SYP-B2076]|uniref:TMEM175 family protein n=1 Tax=Georgenia sp. SYP-B2076 TaxID=2495881 RepID=UPI0013DF09CE|nr:TMEM175 family protein [Georgenia sp. SYP-B2076]
MTHGRARGATGPGPERTEVLHRVAAFTDAAVAIALTLLILPVVELAPEAADARVGALLADHVGELVSFGVSFLAIAAFWRGHRRLFEQVTDYDDTLVGLTFLWLLVIVVIPFPTAMLGAGEGPRIDTTSFYLATLTVGAVVAAAQTAYVRRRPGLQRGGDGPARLRALQAREAASAALFAVATVVALAWPVPALLLLLAMPVATRLGTGLDRTRRRRRR